MEFSLPVTAVNIIDEPCCTTTFKALYYTTGERVKLMPQLHLPGVSSEFPMPYEQPPWMQRYEVLAEWPEPDQAANLRNRAEHCWVLLPGRTRLRLTARAIPLFNNLQSYPSPCAREEASAALEKPRTGRVAWTRGFEGVRGGSRDRHRNLAEVLMDGRSGTAPELRSSSPRRREIAGEFERVRRVRGTGTVTPQKSL